jgi:hypothetical protein
MPISLNPRPDPSYAANLALTNGETLVTRELGRVTTPYREAERFLAYVAAVLSQAETAARAVSAIPTFFDIDSAVGEQLTFLGKRLGFPRCHCVCDATPVYGIACDTPTPGPPIAGMCDDATFRGCGGTSDYCFGDDDVYRAHLVARRYQFLGLYDLESLGAALRAVWGPSAWVPDARGGRVVIAPGRALTAAELTRFSVTLRALPIAPTMEIAVHYGPDPIAGIGTGWGGMCDSVILCPTVVDPYSCGDPPPDPVYGIEGLDTDPIVAGMGDIGTFAACL